MPVGEILGHSFPKLQLVFSCYIMCVRLSSIEWYFFLIKQRELSVSDTYTLIAIRIFHEIIIPIQYYHRCINCNVVMFYSVRLYRSLFRFKGVRVIKYWLIGVKKSVHLTHAFCIALDVTASKRSELSLSYKNFRLFNSLFLWSSFIRITHNWHPTIRPWVRDMESKLSWRRHQMETFSALLAICAGNSPVTGEFPTQRPVTRSFFFSLICAWINGWVNNGEVGDLRRHCAHYDVTLMCLPSWSCRAICNVILCWVGFLGESVSCKWTIWNIRTVEGLMYS